MTGTDDALLEAIDSVVKEHNDTEDFVRHCKDAAIFSSGSRRRTSRQPRGDKQWIRVVAVCNCNCMCMDLHLGVDCILRDDMHDDFPHSHDVFA